MSKRKLRVMGWLRVHGLYAAHCGAAVLCLIVVAQQVQKDSWTMAVLWGLLALFLLLPHRDRRKAARKVVAHRQIPASGIRRNTARLPQAE